MKRLFSLVMLSVIALQLSAQQRVIPLYNGPVPGSENWTWSEAENDNNGFNTKVVYNVSKPTLTAFLPDTSRVNPSGTAVIICPGGGFQALSINSEGNEVAEYLKSKGVAAFVLRYRLVHTLGTDPVKEFGEGDESKRAEQRRQLIPLAVADGRAAIAYVRGHAAEFGVSPDRIGIIGFSAGGTVAASSAYNYTPKNKPDFVAPIYAYMPTELQGAIAADAPPMFLAAATDDGLNLAPHSSDLYTKWIAAGCNAELHLYAKGDHGFGMRKQNLESDTWIDRFSEWLDAHGLITPVKPNSPGKFTAKQHAEFGKYQDELIHVDWANLRAYAQKNDSLKAVAADPKRVVFMGNSITEGWGSIHPQYFAGKPYVNRGISGQTTSQMLARFREDVVELKPALVVILGGINDIAQNTGPISVERIFGNIVAMAEIAKANNIKVAFSSVMPAATIPWRPGIEPIPQIIKLNGLLKDYAAKNKLGYIDYYTPMVDKHKGLDSRYTNEGLHPNLAGYKKMEPIAEKVIQQMLKP